MKRCTLVANEWYGWCTSTSPSRSVANTLFGVSPSDRRGCVAGTNGSSLSSGRSQPYSAQSAARSSSPGTTTTSSSPISSSESSTSRICGSIVSVTSSRTAGPNRRRASSRSRACRRSSSRSSSTSRSALRVTRNRWWATTSRPGNRCGRCAAMRSSSGRNVAPPSTAPTGTNRGTLLGTFTRAKCDAPASGSRTETARLSESPLMYGNGWAGSTASGVRTGKTWSRKYSRSRIASVSARSSQCTIRIPASSSRGATSSWNTFACRCSRSRVRSVTRASCSRMVSQSGERTVSPVLCRRLSPAMRTMKNSSRLLAKIARNLTRSSRGRVSSSASSRTRALKSSQESSRLRKRSAGSGYFAGAVRADAVSRATPSSCRTKMNGASAAGAGQPQAPGDRGRARADPQPERRAESGLRVDVLRQTRPVAGQRAGAAGSVGGSRPRAEPGLERRTDGGQQRRAGAVGVGYEAAPSGSVRGGCGRGERGRELVRVQRRQIGGERGHGRPADGTDPVLQCGVEPAVGLVADGGRAQRAHRLPGGGVVGDHEDAAHQRAVDGGGHRVGQQREHQVGVRGAARPGGDGPQAGLGQREALRRDHHRPRRHGDHVSTPGPVAARVCRDPACSAPVLQGRSWAGSHLREVPVAEQTRPSKWRTRWPIPFGMWVCIATVYPVASLLFRLRYRHGERIPPSGPVLVVANHVSILDPIACARLVFDNGRIPHFLAKESLFRGVVGTILRAAGQIPVARYTSHAQGSVSAAQADLAAGNVIIIYPEGSVTRDPDWWPMESRTGVARLALTTDALVVPVAQWGPQRLPDYHPKKPPPRLRAPADYLVGEPIDLSALRAEVRAGRPLGADLLRETTDLIMSRVRNQLAELRGEPAPTAFHPRPGHTLPGGVSGSAA